LGRAVSLDRQLLGIVGEELAAAELASRGYAILERRYRTAHGEIDIVAEEAGTLVFVEVKARAKFDDAAFSVTDQAKRRIVAAAHAWLAAHPDDVMREIRFDAMLVVPGRMPRHMVNAFDAS
jgi:putative endonuclease